MNLREDEVGLVLEVEERERLCSRTPGWSKNSFVVSSVAIPLGTMQPTRPLVAHQRAVEFGEQRVGVDVAAAAQREAARLPSEVAFALGLAQGVAANARQRAGSSFSGSLAISFLRLEALSAPAIVGAADGEEFLLL